MANPQFYNTNEQKVANIYNSHHALAAEGSLFVATNTTVGTAIATTTSVVDDGNSGATSAQTRPVMLIGNNWQPNDPNAKTIYPLYLKMRIVQVPTSATRWTAVFRLDTFTNAYTSGGSVITPVSTNWGNQTASKAGIYFGAITAAASSGQSRVVGYQVVDSTVPVAADEWLFSFGTEVSSSSIGADSTTQRLMTFKMPAVGISAGGMLKVEMFGASNAAAPSWEFELQYVER